MAGATRPISKEELSSQGRFRNEGGGYTSSYSQAPAMSSGPTDYQFGMGVSPVYESHLLTPNAIEYDEVGYGYDERYSSPILELPETIYNWFVHPVAHGTYQTGKMVVHGTTAVVGAGISGAEYVADRAVHGARYVGDKAYDGANYVGHTLPNSQETRVIRREEHFYGRPYDSGRIVHTSGAGYARPMTSSTISPSPSPFATSARLTPASQQ